MNRISITTKSSQMPVRKLICDKFRQIEVENIIESQVTSVLKQQFISNIHILIFSKN